MNPAHPLIEQKYLGREDLHDFWRTELMVVLDRMPFGLRMFDIALQRGVFDQDPKAKVQVVLRLMVLQAQSSDVDWRAYLEMIPDGVAVELGVDLVNYIEAALKNEAGASEDFCRATLILLSKISSDSLIAMDEVYRDRIKKQLLLSVRLEKDKDILTSAITLFAKHRALYHDDEVESLFSKLKREAKYDKLYKFRKSRLIAALRKEQPISGAAIDCQDQF
jgi:hypothetical protein